MRSSRKNSLATVGLLLLGTAVLVFTQGAAIDEPLTRDVATYAVMARELLAGGDLYSHLWDNKPPLTFVAFAAAFQLFGASEGTIVALNILVTLLTATGVFVVGGACGATGRSGSARVLGAAAVATYAVLAADLSLETNQINTEAFLNALQIWTLALLLGARPAATVRTVVLAATLVATATLFKHVALMFLLPVFAWTAMQRGEDGSWRPAMLLAFVPLVAAWSLLAAYFAATGRGVTFYESLIVYPSYYAGSPGRNLLGLFTFEQGIAPALGRMLLLLGYVVALGFYGVIMQPKRWTVLIAAFLAAAAEIALPGKGHPHYYQLLQPYLAVGLVWGVADLAAPAALRLAAAAAATLLVGWYAVRNLEPYRHDSAVVSRLKFGSLYLDVRAAGRKAHPHAAAGQGLFVWSNDPGLYWYAAARPPTGTLWCSHLAEGPLAERATAKALAALRQAPPALVVMDRGECPDDHPIPRWVLAHYVPEGGQDPAENGRFTFYQRQGSDDQ